VKSALRQTRSIEQLVELMAQDSPVQRPAVRPRK
jgi:hypothetical protein